MILMQLCFQNLQLFLLLVEIALRCSFYRSNFVKYILWPV